MEDVTRDNPFMPQFATIKVDIVLFPNSGMPPAFRVAVKTQTGTVAWLPDLSPVGDPTAAKNRVARAAYEMALEAWSTIG